MHVYLLLFIYYLSGKKKYMNYFLVSLVFLINKYMYLFVRAFTWILSASLQAKPLIRSFSSLGERGKGIGHLASEDAHCVDQANPFRSGTITRTFCNLTQLGSYTLICHFKNRNIISSSFP